jgi:hypothetical protein
MHETTNNSAIDLETYLEGLKLISLKLNNRQVLLLFFKRLISMTKTRRI